MSVELNAKDEVGPDFELSARIGRIRTCAQENENKDIVLQSNTVPEPESRRLFGWGCMSVPATHPRCRWGEDDFHFRHHMIGMALSQRWCLMSLGSQGMRSKPNVLASQQLPNLALMDITLGQWRRWHRCATLLLQRFQTPLAVFVTAPSGYETANLAQCRTSARWPRKALLAKPYGGGSSRWRWKAARRGKHPPIPVDTTTSTATSSRTCPAREAPAYRCGLHIMWCPPFRS